MRELPLMPDGTNVVDTFNVIRAEQGLSPRESWAFAFHAHRSIPILEQRIKEIDPLIPVGIGEVFL